MKDVQKLALELFVGDGRGEGESSRSPRVAAVVLNGVDEDRGH